MAQKAKLTPVDKYESDRREAERLDLEKHARFEAGLIDPGAPFSRRQSLSTNVGKAYRSGRRSRRCSSRLVRRMSRGRRFGRNRTKA
jgi:hypothetical protein